MDIQSLKWLDKIIADVLDLAYSSVDERIDRSIKARKIPILRKSYLDALYERVRYINLPNIPIPREIIELFVELYVFRSVRRLQLETDAPQDANLSVKELLREHKHLFLLGEPGAGKTTFVRRVAYSICRRDNSEFMGLHHDLFPVLIECRHSDIPSAFVSHDKRQRDYERRMDELQKQHGWESTAAMKRLEPPPDPLVIFAAKELESFGFPHPEGFVENLIEDGRVIIFVDGLDEAPLAYRIRIVNSLANLRVRYPKIHLMATCRTAEAESIPSGFAQYEISPLNLPQRQKFARKWFSDPQQATSFLEKVSNTHIWDVSDRPLLLTLLCALYQTGGDLPRFKVDLYKECTELAMRKWDTYRSIKRETAFDFLSLNQRLDILAKVGAKLTSKGKTVEGARAIDSWFQEAMEEIGVEGNATELREEIVRQSGLLQQVALDRFSFSHKSLQEYFAALYYSRVEPLLPASQLFFDRQWLATTEMTACMVPDAGQIFGSLLQAGRLSAMQLSANLTVVLRILFSNPVTISSRSREQLIQKVLAGVQSIRKDFVKIIPVWRQRFEKIGTEDFSRANGSLIQVHEYESTVFISWREYSADR